MTRAKTSTATATETQTPARARVGWVSFVGAGLLGLKEGDGIDWPDASGRERRLTAILIEP